MNDCTFMVSKGGKDKAVETGKRRPERDNFADNSTGAGFAAAIQTLPETGPLRAGFRR